MQYISVLTSCNQQHEQQSNHANSMITLMKWVAESKLSFPCK